jgi:hypothetical protein
LRIVFSAWAEVVANAVDNAPEPPPKTIRLKRLSCDAKV